MVLENGYEIVPVRIEKFWMRYPNGRIDVKVIHYNLGWTDDFEATVLGI